MGKGFLTYSSAVILRAVVTGIFMGLTSLT